MLCFCTDITSFQAALTDCKLSLGPLFWYPLKDCGAVVAKLAATSVAEQKQKQNLNKMAHQRGRRRPLLRLHLCRCTDPAQIAAASPAHAKAHAVVRAGAARAARQAQAAF